MEIHSKCVFILRQNAQRTLHIHTLKYESKAGHIQSRFFSKSHRMLHFLAAHTCTCSLSHEILVQREKRQKKWWLYFNLFIFFCDGCRRPSLWGCVVSVWISLNNGRHDKSICELFLLMHSRRMLTNKTYQKMRVLSLVFTMWWRLCKSHTTVFGVCPFRKSYRTPVVNVSVSGTWNDYYHHFNMTHSQFPVTFKRLPGSEWLPVFDSLKWLNWKWCMQSTWEIIIVIIHNKIMYNVNQFEEYLFWLWKNGKYIHHYCI